MWDDNYDDDDDMELYEIECLREDARLDREEAEEAEGVQYFFNKYGIEVEIEI